MAVYHAITLKVNILHFVLILNSCPKRERERESELRCKDIHISFWSTLNQRTLTKDLFCPLENSTAIYSYYKLFVYVHVSLS
jgi:hypothetical protein